MKTLLTTTAAILVMATTATASPKSCPVKTDTNGVQIIKKGCAAFVGATGPHGPQGEQGPQGQQGVAGSNGQDGAQGLTGDAGANGKDGTNGTNGEDGINGTNGVDGAAGSDGSDGRDGLNGTDGATGSSGSDGVDGRDGANALGSLSFAAASASFYGDGMGFGLSNSTYGDLEGSVVFGFDIDGDWHVVAGITTDFKGKTAGSIGVGVSF